VSANLDPLDKSERDAVAAATIAALLLIAHQVAARALRDAFFLSAFDVRSLPFVMMASAVLALAGAEALAVALTRRAPGRVVPAAAWLSALLLVVEWGLARTWPRPAAVVVYLHVATFGGTLVSGFWSLVNERFDPYTARRVVGRIGAGATAGGVAGGVIAWIASQVLDVTTVILLVGALHAGAAVFLRRTGRDPSTVGTADGASAPALGLPALWRTPLLRQIAAVVALGAGVEAILDFLFKAEAAGRLPAGGSLLSFFALFHAGISVLALLLQLLFARAALERLGIAATLGLRAALTGASSVVGAFLPRLETATLARGSHDALTNSLFRSSYELLYAPLPEAEKRRVKALVDVGVDKAGTLVGSGIVLGTLALLPLTSTPALFVLAALGSVGALLMTAPLHRRYLASLEASLVAGRVRLDPTDVLDRATQVTLAETSLIEREALLRRIEELRGGPASSLFSIPPAALEPPPAPAPEKARLAEELDALRSREPGRVRRVLAANPEPGPVLVAALVPLLAVDECLPDVLRALRLAAPRVTGQLLDTLLDPELDPLVRRRVPRVLKACATDRAAEGLARALDDPLYEVRAAASAALASINERSPVSRVTRLEVLDRVRRELDSGEPVDRQLPHLFALLSLILERQPLRVAWAAVRADDRALRGTALEYLSNVLPDDVFPRLVSLFGASAVRFARPQRSVEQVAEELRTSAVGLRLELPPWQDAGEG
jgi:AAA family ATP:ADP antiporter